MKNILVLGASGFLGRFLIKNFKNNKLNVHYPNSSEVNILNYSDLKNLDHSYDEIFYLAAWTQAGDFCLKNPAKQWIINQTMNTNLINWWHEKQRKAKLIFIGSSCVYGDKSDLKENNFLTDIPHESLVSYAMSKKMLMHGAISCQKQFNMKWFCGIPATLYGPNYHTDNRQPHFIYDLIKKIMRGKFLNKEVILWGNGNQRRELIHVEDFCKILLNLNSEIDNDLINIGNKLDLSIKEYAKKICEIVDYDFKKIEFDNTKFVGVFEKKLNISKVRKLIKNYDQKLTNIDTGINEIVEWYKLDNKYK